MTKAEAIKELMRCADICPTTPLAEACRTLIAWAEQPHDCGTCKHAAQLAHTAPCIGCSYSIGYPDNWEPKEVDNGKTN